MDKFSKSKRSEIMSGIRSSKTKFEKLFIFELKRHTNKKFKTNVKSVKGKPDIVFENERLCVFLDSDFWHGWQYPRWGRFLKNDFWRCKLENNRKRDRKNTTYLRKNGWRVLRLWGHEILNDRNKAIGRIENLLIN